MMEVAGRFSSGQDAVEKYRSLPGTGLSLPSKASQTATTAHRSLPLGVMLLHRFNLFFVAADGSAESGFEAKASRIGHSGRPSP